jgi:hypothetical protein
LILCWNSESEDDALSDLEYEEEWRLRLTFLLESSSESESIYGRKQQFKFPDRMHSWQDNLRDTDRDLTNRKREARFL